MKQNEKILVYAVTGFLFVIFAVAVIFGNGSSSRAESPPTEVRAGSAAQTLEDLLRGQGQVLPEADRPLVVEQPLVSNVQLAPPTAAEELGQLLGRSRRDRDCRIVKVRSGDTLRELVLRWCGGLEEHLALAERMNEDGTTLRVGQELVLPWVEDEELLAMHRERQGRRATAVEASLGPTSPAAPQPGVAAPAAAVAGAFRTYVVKAGDMLWKIAEREVGAAKAYPFIQQVKELNPDLDVDRLRVGQEIRLPAKGG